MEENPGAWFVMWYAIWLVIGFVACLILLIFLDDVPTEHELKVREVEALEKIAAQNSIH